MTRTQQYRIDGRTVVTTRCAETWPIVYTLVVDDMATRGHVEKTVLGRYRAIDHRGRLIGQYLTLRAALSTVVRSGLRLVDDTVGDISLRNEAHVRELARISDPDEGIHDA